MDGKREEEGGSRNDLETTDGCHPTKVATTYCKHTPTETHMCLLLTQALADKGLQVR